jgi:multiple sugar transport system permease protein
MRETGMKARRYRIVTTVALLAAQSVFGAEAISVDNYYNPNTPEDPTTRRLIELMREEPDIQIKKWGGIQLPGAAGKASLMMAIAGRTAPEVGYSWFHFIRSEIRQGFLYPLNEWIGDDLDGDGQIGDAEARWEGWKEVPPLWRRVATVDGKVYGIPRSTLDYVGVVFRTDLARAAGLNPNRPPETWGELIYWCQKLTDPGKTVPGALSQRGQRGIAVLPNGFLWLPWMQSAGGDPIVQVRRSPSTGREYTFAPEATTFVTAEGADLSGIEPEWRANFASPAGIAACGLYHDLFWKPWLIDPKTGEPVNLTPEELAAGKVRVGERVLAFTEKDVIKGMARGHTGQREDDPLELLSRSEVAMVPFFATDLTLYGSRGIDPDLLGWFPFPAGPPPHGRRVVQVQRHYIIAYEGISEKNKEQRDRIWRVMTAIADESTRNNEVRTKVLSGMARFANPDDLKRLGYEEYLRDIPEATRQVYREIAEGRIAAFTEPWSGYWLAMDTALNTQVNGLIMAQTGEDFDYAAALKEVEARANSGVMFATPRATLDRYRWPARVVFAVIAGIMAFFVVLIVRGQLRRGAGGASCRNVYNRWVAWGLVMPALLLIGLWSYYPLLRGMVMAFQNYRITGGSTFVGLDNFIALAMDGSFWRSLLRTVYFVALNMTLAFSAPILLAILLTEVPRFKIFFRTLFFLPQMTSGLVIALLWKLMYTPTPEGFFNRLIALLNRLPFVSISMQTWLQDPRLAMLCCVIPTVWASMGMASLIYLAALHSIPPDFYEAAEIDGAGIFKKLTRITIPTILPLIIINFVGTFIGTFQNMGNIFLMTFGGPGESTTVVGLRIWIEAYNNLRFSMATSMAWVLGSLLIGFTYVQIKFLGKVEYRKAQE